MNDRERSTRLRRAAALAVIALILLAGRPEVARAHEEGVLKPATRVLSPGDSLSLAGEKFAHGASLSLWVVGVSGRTQLARVRTDTAGAFALRLLVPATVTPGSYRMVAVADDGDEVAGLDVTVVAAATSHEGHEGMPIDEAPTAEPLALDRARSPLVTGVALGGIVLALGVGLMLLRASRTDGAGATRP